VIIKRSEHVGLEELAVINVLPVNVMWTKFCVLSHVGVTVDGVWFGLVTQFIDHVHSHDS
jgi:hypothetical protein